MLAPAKRHGVKQFLPHGSVLAGDNILLFPQFSRLRNAATLHDKGRAEQLLIGSGLSWTIIRHGRVPGDPQPPATGHAYLTPDQSVLGDVTRADLAMLTLDCLDHPARLNKVFHAVDPSYRIDRPLPGNARPD